MSFKFFKHGKEISAPRRISWRFKGHSQIFESAPEKLDINRSFWRQKLGLAHGAEIQILADNFDIEIKQDDATNIPLPTDHTPDIAIDNGPDLESPLSETPEDTVDSTKHKSKRKTTELPDVSPLVAYTDDTIND